MKKSHRTSRAVFPFLFLLWCQINAGNFWRSYKWKCMMYFSDMIAQNITAPFTLSQRHDHERRFYENIHICHIFHCNRDHLCCNHIYFISSFGKIQSSLVNGDLWFLKVIWSKVLNLKHLSPFKSLWVWYLLQTARKIGAVKPVMSQFHEKLLNIFSHPPVPECQKTPGIGRH